MNLSADAAAILRRLREVGVSIRAEAGDLYAKPQERLTPELLAELRAHKPELLAALCTPLQPVRVTQSPASLVGALPTAPSVAQQPQEASAQPSERSEADEAADLREHFEERAAILEFDGKLPRSEAEREAAKAAFLFARSMRYSWRALRAALPAALTRGLPEGAGPVYGTPPWGLPRWAVTPAGKPTQQGAFTAKQSVEPLQ